MVPVLLLVTVTLLFAIVPPLPSAPYMEPVLLLVTVTVLLLVSAGPSPP